MQTPLTFRDQIALDIYKLLVVAPERKHISAKSEARTAYDYANAFLVEMKVRAPEAPEAPIPPMPTPAEGELDDDHPLWGINAQITGLLEGYGANEDHEMVIHFLRQTGLPKSTVGRIHKAICCAEVAKQTPPMPTPAEERKTVTPVVGKYFWTRKNEVVNIVDIIESENMLFRYKGLSNSNLYYYYNEKGVNSDGPAFDLVEECPF